MTRSSVSLRSRTESRAGLAGEFKAVLNAEIGSQTPAARWISQGKQTSASRAAAFELPMKRLVVRTSVRGNVAQ